jgi:uncharacterized protein (TIGR00255 family)
MTGYGRGESSNNDVTVVVELKSVNNRFRDLQVRSPREYVELESKISQVLKDAIHRGRVDVAVRRTAKAPAVRVVAHVGLAQEYARVIRELADQMGQAPEPRALDYILQQPGVLTVADIDLDAAAEWSVVELALRAGLAALLEMRGREGQALCDEIAGLLGETRAAIADIERLVDGVHERLRQRLEGRIQRMGVEGLDPHRLVQEVALLADKSDVTEELVRLRSHLERFAEALASEEPIGRRLDFLLQEMNREVNTIGSKAIEHPVSDRVVELKSTLERLREQAANVE